MDALGQLALGAILALVLLLVLGLGMAIGIKIGIKIASPTTTTTTPTTTILMRTNHPAHRTRSCAGGHVEVRASGFIGSIESELLFIRNTALGRGGQIPDLALDAPGPESIEYE